MVAAADYHGDAAIFNIGSGIGRSLNKVIIDLETVLGHQTGVDYMPPRGFDVPSSVLDCTLAKRELGWCATSDWMTSLRTCCDWIRDDLEIVSGEGTGNGN